MVTCQFYHIRYDSSNNAGLGAQPPTYDIILATNNLNVGRCGLVLPLRLTSAMYSASADHECCAAASALVFFVNISEQAASKHRRDSPPDAAGRGTDMDPAGRVGYGSGG